jgi:hypothetical protein
MQYIYIEIDGIMYSLIFRSIYIPETKILNIRFSKEYNLINLAMKYPNLKIYFIQYPIYLISIHISIYKYMYIFINNLIFPKIYRYLYIYTYILLYFLEFIFEKQRF